MHCYLVGHILNQYPFVLRSKEKVLVRKDASRAAKKTGPSGEILVYDYIQVTSATTVP